MNSDAAFDCLAANEAKYQALLTEEYEAALKRDDGRTQLRGMAKPDHARIATAVHTAATGHRANLVYAGATEDDIEEYLFSVQGYIVRSRLPPITDNTSFGNNPRQAAQSLTLSGLGTDVFEESVRGMLEIYSHIGRNLPRDSLLPWKPRILNGKICLDFSNRYFSTPREAEGQELRDLSTHVDPLHILRKYVPQGIHTADNEVLYYERSNSDKEKPIYGSINPTELSIGHLVEVQVGFCAVPVKRNQYQFITKLRAVCVLSREVDSDVNKACIEKLKASCIGTGRPLKRRVGYEVADGVQQVRSVRHHPDPSADVVDDSMQGLKI